MYLSAASPRQRRCSKGPLVCARTGTMAPRWDPHRPPWARERSVLPLSTSTTAVLQARVICESPLCGVIYAGASGWEFEDSVKHNASRLQKRISGQAHVSLQLLTCLPRWMDSEPTPSHEAPAAAAAPNDDDDLPSDLSSPPPVVSPPYWQTQHARSWSNGSLDRSRPAPIALEDHEELGSETSKALWAKHVTVDEPVVVSGNAPSGLGAYVVWNCTVDTLDAIHWTPLKLAAFVEPPPACGRRSRHACGDRIRFAGNANCSRNIALTGWAYPPAQTLVRFSYSEFDKLRHNLVRTFPHANGAIPPLPPKSVILCLSS
ncbi:hypothetical protein NA57DRAFT_55825 [Rhizodiscina lignyota]|uniref:PX domain-containing protein n=1 Tax=Rhizodiscina lignyota TaxID=1504668 RepID=A0A9P4IE27_9PEZI|nr:hypothetical protein NA57DRAFT_55825 [Rhizodiscina lignyota]